MALSLGQLPGRVAAGGYILHTGLDKWHGPPEQAEAVHGMAAAAYPFLASMPAPRFLRLLAAGEIATGALLLAPFVPGRVAGLALTGFSAGLLGLYARTPAFRQPGSVWPSQVGTAVSKDVWLLGIGLGLLAGSRRRRRT